MYSLNSSLPMQLLIDHEESIAPDSKDPIHEILKELGPSPSIETLVGESTLFLLLQ